MMKSLRERFDEKWMPVTESGCWLWVAHCSQNGYARLKLGGAARDAHRISYELHIGAIPVGLQVLHHCDTPSCVRPDHLFLGTHQDNMDDKIEKKRHVFGEGHPGAKVGESVVRAIRVDSGTQREIAKQHGISQTQVHRIITGENWGGNI